MLRLITILEIGPQRTSAIVVGIDASSPTARPTVVDGTGTLAPGGLILDQAMARRFDVAVGDTLRSQGRTFRVTGLSRGTNVVLTQMAFITHDAAEALLGFPGVTSFLLVRAAADVPEATLLQRLRDRSPQMTVLPHRVFAENNMDELRGGLLPILATVAVLGGLDAIVVLALMLYGSVLERRIDYAILKAIGASDRMLAALIIRQSLAAVAGGLALGIVAYVAAAPVILRIVPAMLLDLSVQAVLAVAASALVTGLVGALWPLRRIARIHPAEVCFIVRLR